MAVFFHLPAGAIYFKEKSILGYDIDARFSKIEKCSVPFHVTCDGGR